MSNFAAGVYETYFSDHEPIFIGFNVENTTQISSNGAFTVTTGDLQIETEQTNQHEPENSTPTNNSTTMVDIIDEVDITFKHDQIEHAQIKYNTPKVTPQTLEGNILEIDSWLDDRAINSTLDVIQSYSQFNPNDIIYLQWRTCVEPVFTVDLKILGGNKSLHWLCIYFDRLKLHIYDSLYSDTLSCENLEEQEKKFIQKRYPSLSKKDMIVENVIKQPDLSSSERLQRHVPIYTAASTGPS